MVKHVVTWKLRGPSPEDKRAQAERIRDTLESLRGKIPGMSSIEVGIGAPSDAERGDVVLVTTHDDWRALDAYQEHADHLAAAKIIGELRIERRVVDFEL
jgi:hypothetical protein